MVKNETLKIALEHDQNSVVKNFSNDLKKNDWDPDTFSDLCASALKMKDQELLNFCNTVSAFEWKLLLDHCNSVTNPM